MAIPGFATLRAQLHCLSRDGQVVITAQHWVDPRAEPSRPRSWLRLVRNGEVRQDRQYGGRRRQEELAARWSALAADYESTKLDDEQMWVELRRRVSIVSIHCQGGGCSSVLPVGWWICPVCGRDARRVASGALSGARRRGTIVIRADASRNTQNASRSF